MNIAKTSSVLVCVLALSACDGKMRSIEDIVPDMSFVQNMSAMSAPAAPQSVQGETMLESVSFSIASQGDLDALEYIVSQDVPTSADIRCMPSDEFCMRTKELFEKAQVPSQWVGNSGEAAHVTLNYQRIVPAGQ